MGFQYDCPHFTSRYGALPEDLIKLHNRIWSEFIDQTASFLFTPDEYEKTFLKSWEKEQAEKNKKRKKKLKKKPLPPKVLPPGIPKAVGSEIFYCAHFNAGIRIAPWTRSQGSYCPCPQVMGLESTDAERCRAEMTDILITAIVLKIIASGFNKVKSSPYYFRKNRAGLDWQLELRDQGFHWPFLLGLEAQLDLRIAEFYRHWFRPGKRSIHLDEFILNFVFDRSELKERIGYSLDHYNFAPGATIVFGDDGAELMTLFGEENGLELFADVVSTAGGIARQGQMSFSGRSERKSDSMGVISAAGTVGAFALTGPVGMVAAGLALINPIMGLSRKVRKVGKRVFGRKGVYVQLNTAKAAGSPQLPMVIMRITHEDFEFQEKCALFLTSSDRIVFLGKERTVIMPVKSLTVAMDSPQSFILKKPGTVRRVKFTTLFPQTWKAIFECYGILERGNSDSPPATRELGKYQVANFLADKGMARLKKALRIALTDGKYRPLRDLVPKQRKD